MLLSKNFPHSQINKSKGIKRSGSGSHPEPPVEGSTIRYIFSNNNQPDCPLHKSCFLKAKKQRELRIMQQEKNVTKSGSMLLPQYMYKSTDPRARSSVRSGRSSVRESQIYKSHFLKSTKIKREKIPVNIFAVEGVITGDLGTRKQSKSLNHSGIYS